MVRTQIYLPESIHKRLRGLAKKRKLSMAHLIRKYVLGGMNKESNQLEAGHQIMQKISQLNITGGPKDLSLKLDHYLYE